MVDGRELALCGIIFCTLAACTHRGIPTPLETVSATSTAAESTNSADARQEQATTDERLLMVEKTIVDRGVSDERVLAAMRTVPRHEFVPDDYLDSAYEDHPLPIGYGQTISQPYVVAWMTELLQLEVGEKVLEIGTGSGYQAAVLVEVDDIEVYSIEIVPELAQEAEERLTRLGYTSIQLLESDGYYGWEEHAPFDAIIVTAAPDHLPAPLVAQLKEGGRLVIPIGPAGGYQSLWRFVKENGELTAYNLGGVSFVPFTGSGVGEPEAIPLP